MGRPACRITCGLGDLCPSSRLVIRRRVIYIHYMVAFREPCSSELRAPVPVSQPGGSSWAVSCDRADACAALVPARVGALLNRLPRLTIRSLHKTVVVVAVGDGAAPGPD